MRKYFNIYGSGMANAHPWVRIKDIGFEGRAFRDKPIKAEWEPPRFEVVYKRKPLRDLLGGMVRTTIVSEKFVDVFCEELSETSEFLPLGAISKHAYFVWHIFGKAACLDPKRTVIRADICNSYALNLARVPPTYMCFKVPENPFDVFVSDRFAKLVLAHGLTGIGLRFPEDGFFNPLAPKIAGFPT